MKNQNILYAAILSILIGISLPAHTQVINLAKYRIPFGAENVFLYGLNADTIFKEKQNVIVAEIRKVKTSDIKKVNLSKKQLAIAWSDSVLKKTSQFAEENDALIALNGSFFNVEKGGSVAYLESEGKVVARNRNPKEKWAKSDSLLNGAIVIDYKGNLIIEVAKPESFYEQSDNEQAVLVSGPALLAEGKKLQLQNTEFVNKRHPRSCLCNTYDGSILFIAIDGRSEVAAGMNLKEVQDFLQRLKCRDAINLDGGGSTTLWMNDGNKKGILNNPSDKKGERPVANIILIRE
jgi:exopolysaccharide biosynthesis protein